MSHSRQVDPLSIAPAQTMMRVPVLFVHVSIKSEFEGRNGWGFLCIFGQAISSRIVDGKKEL